MGRPRVGSRPAARRTVFRPALVVLPAAAFVVEDPWAVERRWLDRPRTAIGREDRGGPEDLGAQVAERLGERVGETEGGRLGARAGQQEAPVPEGRDVGV